MVLADLEEFDGFEFGIESAYLLVLFKLILMMFVGGFLTHWHFVLLAWSFWAW